MCRLNYTKFNRRLTIWGVSHRNEAHIKYVYTKSVWRAEQNRAQPWLLCAVCFVYYFNRSHLLVVAIRIGLVEWEQPDIVTDVSSSLFYFFIIIIFHQQPSVQVWWYWKSYFHFRFAMTVNSPLIGSNQTQKTKTFTKSEEKQFSFCPNESQKINTSSLFGGH